MRTLFLLALLGALAQGQDLAVLRLSPPAKTRPGEFVVQVWQITNPSTAPISVRIVAELPQGWEALGLPPVLSLAPEETDYLFLALYVPRAARSGTHVVRLRFRWNDKEAVSEGHIEVEAVAALELVPPPPQAAEPGAAVGWTLRVVNRGNVVDRVAVAVRTASGWHASARPSEVVLAPGEAGEVQVAVGIPAGAPVGREVVWALVRSGTAPEVEARTAWYVEVLPPGPERVPVQIHAELAMQGFARFSYDFLSGNGVSFLGFSGRGAVLAGALELSGRWAGPWAPQPYQFLDFQALYVTDVWEVQAGRVSFSFPALFSPLGFWGVGARFSGSTAHAAFASGGEGGVVRAGGHFLFRPPGVEAGAAYREERGDGLHTQGGALRLGLLALENLWFRVDGGAARVQGLTRFAGQMGLTWQIPELFFLEGRGYAVDPGFPGLVPDRAGVLLSGRLGAEQAGFRFLWEWQRDNLRGLSLTTRAWQAVQAGWDLFPSHWPLRLGFILSLRRTLDLSWPPALDERVARAEGFGSVSHQGFSLGIRAAYARLEDLVSGRSWLRQEFLEWLELRPTAKVILRGELRQVLLLAPEEDLRQDEASFAFSVDEKLRLLWTYGRDGGAVRAEVLLEPSPLLTLRIGGEARWRATAEPVRLGALLEFAYGFSWAPPFLPVHGLLSGLVFADLNGNGVRDPDEPGVPGAILALADLQVSSGKDGEFRFPGRPPGPYRLQVQRVPAGYAPRAQEFPVSLGLGTETRLFVPLLPLATLSGLVFLDGNADGVPDPGEPGLSRVYLRLVAEDGRTTELLTDPGGRFTWGELLPGRYRVELIVEALPVRHEPTTPTRFELAVRPGERKEVVFGVWERPRPVRVIQPPWAEFTWRPGAPKAGEPVLFDASLSQAFEAELVEFLWDFNDDGEVDAEGLRVSWIFPEPGVYLVTLVVVDSAGLTGRTQYLLPISP